MPSYFVTGSSRGIGLSLAEELLEKPDSFVIATARNPSSSKGLQALQAKYPKDRLVVISFDVSDPVSIQKGVEAVTPLLPNGLDYLINNAGVHNQPQATFDDIDFKLFEDDLKFNTQYIILATRALLPLVRKGAAKKIVFMSSVLGSIQLGGSFPGLTNAYSITKSALNMVGRKWGALLKTEGINLILLHPGWVKTDIGDAIIDGMATLVPHLKQLSPKESVVGCVKVIHEAPLEEATSFYNYDNTKLPW